MNVYSTKVQNELKTLTGTKQQCVNDVMKWIKEYKNQNSNTQLTLTNKIKDQELTIKLLTINIESLNFKINKLTEELYKRNL